MCVCLHTYFQYHLCFCYKIQLYVNFSGEKNSKGSSCCSRCVSHSVGVSMGKLLDLGVVETSGSQKKREREKWGIHSGLVWGWELIRKGVKTLNLRVNWERKENWISMSFYLFKIYKVSVLSLLYPPSQCIPLKDTGNVDLAIPFPLVVPKSQGKCYWQHL